jgi:hypothetical protein
VNLISLRAAGGQDTPETLPIMQGGEAVNVDMQGKRTGNHVVADAEQRTFPAGIFAPLGNLDESQSVDETLHGDGLFPALPFETPFDFSNSTGFGFFPLLSYSPDFLIPNVVPVTATSPAVLEAIDRDRANPSSGSLF